MARVDKADNPVLEFARTAFANGYSIHGELPLLGRSKTAYKASQRLLEASKDDGAAALSLIAAAGANEGLYAKIYKRRDRLWMKYDMAVKRWERKLSLKIDHADLETEVAKALQAAPDKNSRQREEVKTVVSAYLANLLIKHPELSAEIFRISAEASAESKAEGAAAAAALLAHSRNQKVPDLAKEAKANLNQQKKLRSYGSNASKDSKTMLNGLAGDVAIAAAPNEGNNQNTGSNYAAIIGAGVGSSFYADYINHAYWALALLALLSSESPSGKVNFVTVGDGKVCKQCLEAEDGNPYAPSAVPDIPQHVSCRCWYTPAD